MAAVQKGTTVIWSVNGITCGGIVGSGIEQSFSRSLSSASKEIIGDGGDCQTKVFTNAKADLSEQTIVSMVRPKKTSQTQKRQPINCCRYAYLLNVTAPTTHSA